MSIFSYRLKELRKRKGFSQKQLSNEIKVSQANISRWEKGTQDPLAHWLILLAVFFEVKVDYLLGLKN